MTAYAALLRGITPSGRNMTNDKLRPVFERLGLASVASVLASGNIVFTSPETDVRRLEDRVEKALAGDLGVRSRAVIRSHAELRRLLDTDPFAGLTHGRGSYLTATFLKQGAPDGLVERPDPRTRVVGYDEAARAVLAVTDNSAPGATPDFMAYLETVCGRDVTTRTWATVQRIVTRLEP